MHCRIETPSAGSGLKLFQGALRSGEFKLKSGINFAPLPRRMSALRAHFSRAMAGYGLPPFIPF
jgi:hypothetical protein